MESFSVQGINLSSIPTAIANYNNANNASNESTNPTNTYVNAINRYAQEKENEKQTIKKQLIELKREEEKKVSREEFERSAQLTLDKTSVASQLSGGGALKSAFSVRVDLLERVKSELESAKEQTANISTLTDKYKSEAKKGNSDYAKKALHLLDNVSELGLSEHIVQEPIHQIFAQGLHDFYDMYSNGGASEQLDGLGDNITLKSLGLNNLGKDFKKISNALDKAIDSVDNVIKEVKNKYYNIFGKNMDTSPKEIEASSCDDIEKWLAYSIEHDEMNNDKIGYTKREDIMIKNRPFYVSIDGPKYTEVDILI